MTWLRPRFVLMCLACLFPASGFAQAVMAPGAGSQPVVHVLYPDGRALSFLAYDPAFRGGVRVALGDVNGDGVLDIITAAGPGGGPHVRVFSGVDLSEIWSFYAYDPAFAGGVFVAAGDMDGDGRADIITGAGPGGGPHVKVFSGADLSELASFFAYEPAFVGGVSVAAGDVNGDGLLEIITGAGPGGGPRVSIFNLAGGTLDSFYLYGAYLFTGGVQVASGDIGGDGFAEIIAALGPGSAPEVAVLRAHPQGCARSLCLGGWFSFFAYDPLFYGGVSVGAVDFYGDGRAEIITGAGPGGGPHVKIWNTSDLSLLESFWAFDPSFTGGVSVGSVANIPALRFTSFEAMSFTIGSFGSFAVEVAGSSGPISLTTTGALPAGVSFANHGDGTATLAGTPDPGTAGTYHLTFTATAGRSKPASQIFTLLVR